MTTTRPQPGCYVDSHWGQYAVARAVQVTLEFGWKDDEASDLAARHLAAMGPSAGPDLGTDDIERLVGASDDAEAWLNDNVSLEGHCWCWNEGDFGLYPLEDEEEQ